MPFRRARIGRFTRATSCTGKHRFTGAKARRQAERRSLVTGERVIAYPCPFCPHWHIGHPNPQRRERAS